MQKSDRRKSRRLTVQFLYHWDMNQESSLEDALALFWQLTNRDEAADAVTPKTESIRNFARDLIFGTIQHHTQINAWLKEYAQNWDLPRMSPVDRNILRLALYEMHYNVDVPPVSAINEAIELAKELGNEESAKFINGILDRAKVDVLRPLR
jgi:N utilization substance protein B